MRAVIDEMSETLFSAHPYIGRPRETGQVNWGTWATELGRIEAVGEVFGRNGRVEDQPGRDVAGAS